MLALEHYLDERRLAPAPSPKRRGEHLIALPASLSLKIALLNEMIAQNVRPAELARRLKTSKQEVNRLTTLTHPTSWTESPKPSTRSVRISRFKVA